MPGAGAFGPYPHGHRFRVLVRHPNGDRGYRSFATERAAEEYRDAAAAEIAKERGSARTVKDAIAAYGEHQKEKGNRESGMEQTKYRLEMFLAEDLDGPLGDLSDLRCAALYKKLRETTYGDPPKVYSVDYQRNILAETRSFLAWCVEKGWLGKNPIAKVKGTGRRKHGKPQLTIDEARKWLEKATALAAAGDAGAIAALCALLLAMRASEIVERRVRDLDDGGRLLHITSAKTAAGVRTLELPELLRPMLGALAEGKKPTDLLFGQHWRDWPRENVQRICKLAKVPPVTAHGMRGLHSTLAIQAGATAHLVAAALGHESTTTTLQSYADKGKVEEAGRARGLKMLKGGKR